MSHQTILILDFGSQFTQLIARRLRELSVYCEILPFHTPIDELRARKPVGLILSGGPKSVSEPGAPKSDPEVLQLGTPVLGICYGMQAQREKFVTGAVKNGITEKKATRIFDLMEHFAGYGFNKSHSTTYAFLAYQTAYLKANHCQEFLAASMTLDMCVRPAR